jgi:hypothetical protein
MKAARGSQTGTAALAAVQQFDGPARQRSLSCMTLSRREQTMDEPALLELASEGRTNIAFIVTQIFAV